MRFKPLAFSRFIYRQIYFDIEVQKRKDLRPGAKVGNLRPCWWHGVRHSAFLHYDGTVFTMTAWLFSTMMARWVDFLYYDGTVEWVSLLWWHGVRLFSTMMAWWNEFLYYDRMAFLYYDDRMEWVSLLWWDGVRLFSTLMGWREACRSPVYMALRPVHTRLMPTGVHPYRRAMATYRRAMAMIIITLNPLPWQCPSSSCAQWPS